MTETAKWIHAAITKLTDATFEPASFHTNGTLQEVVAATLKAIALEEGRDERYTGNALSMGPSNGSLSFDRGVTSRIGLTRGAFIQIAETLHAGGVRGAKDRRLTPTRWVDGALWAEPSIRALLFSQMRDGATAAKRNVTHTFRIAKDVHGPDASGVEYLRAVNGLTHSAGAGDDAAYLAALNNFSVNHPDNGFAGGLTTVRRNPAGDTRLVVDSRNTLPGGARLTMSFTNNEIGGGSANVGLSLTFQIDAVDANKPTERIQLEIPGAHGRSSAIHRGSRPGHMFESFAESVMLVLGWAPTALEKMRSAILGDAATRCEVLFDGLESDELRVLQSNVHDLIERIREQGIAPANSALEVALVLAKFGDAAEAMALVQKFGGAI